MTFIAQTLFRHGGGGVLRAQHPRSHEHAAAGPAGPGGTPQTVTSTVVYRNLTSAGPAGRRAGDMQLGPLTFSIETPESGEVKFEIASARADRMDVAAVAHIFDDEQVPRRRGRRHLAPARLAGQLFGLLRHRPGRRHLQPRRGRRSRTSTAASRRSRSPTLWDKILDPAISEDAKSDLALEALARHVFGVAGRHDPHGRACPSTCRPSRPPSRSAASPSPACPTEGIDSFIMKSLRGEEPGRFRLARHRSSSPASSSPTSRR